MSETGPIGIPWWFEDRTPSPIEVVPSYPIIEATMLCLETQNELQQCIECVICQEDKPILDCNTINCGHSFCHGCITKHINSKGKDRPSCPLCRTPIISLQIKDIENFQNFEHNFGRIGNILKDCVTRVMGYQPQSAFDGTHLDFINFIVDELDRIEYDEQVSKLVYSKDNDLERAEALWRYLWEKGVGENSDISYTEFVRGIDEDMIYAVNILDMPDTAFDEVY
jgi:hypothetical protein